MSKNYALDAVARDQAGKGAARSLRRENKTPAVIYGDKKDPLKVSLDTNEINVEYNRGHMYTTLCDLSVDGTKHLVLARDVQVHPVSDNVIHVDFLRVTSKTKIAVFVPVQFINEDKSPGLSNKAIMNVVRHEVELLCSAMSIPDNIEVNMEGKDTGDAIKISDASLPEGTTPIISDRDFTIATLSAPRTIEEEPTAAEEGEEGAEASADGEGSGEGAGDKKPAEGDGGEKAEEKSE